MKSRNKVQLIGYIGKDPDFKQLPSGDPLAVLRLATHSYVFKKDESPVKKTAWHTVKLWRAGQIERIRNYLVKGSHIMVEGSIIYRHYTNKEGAKRFVTDIHASAIVDLDR